MYSHPTPGGCSPQVPACQQGRGPELPAPCMCGGVPEGAGDRTQRTAPPQAPPAAAPRAGLAPQAR